MKKWLVFMAAILVIAGLNAALAEGVMLITEENSSANVTSLDDMRIDVPVDLGDTVYTVKMAEMNEALLALYVETFNFQPKTVSYFKDAKVTATYVGDRGEYVFEGYSYGDITVAQLASDTACFFCEIPPYVSSNKGELRMEITTGNIVLTYYFRK